jgi:hypothetical protein
MKIYLIPRTTALYWIKTQASAEQKISEETIVERRIKALEKALQKEKALTSLVAKKTKECPLSPYAEKSFKRGTLQLCETERPRCRNPWRQLAGTGGESWRTYLPSGRGRFQHHEARSIIRKPRAGREVRPSSRS